MRELWGERAKLRAQAAVEVALAQAQEAMALIPQGAAEAIEKASAGIDKWDLEAMADEGARLKHTFTALINKLATEAGEFGEWVHFGATTQDVVDTGTILQIRDSGRLITQQIEELTGVLLQRVREHRDTAMVGRTHGMHALPTTFGYILAIYLDELSRHRTRLQRSLAEVATGNIAGGVGNHGALGHTVGRQVELKALEILDLQLPDTCWASARDRLTSYASVLSILSGMLGRFGRELYNLMRTDIGEIEEPWADDNVGSTTMPQKRNPAMCESLASLTPPVKRAMNLMLDAQATEHERDAMSWRSEWIALPEIHIYLSAQLNLATKLLQGLTVHRKRMQENLGKTGSFIYSERLMIELGRRIGKMKAHHVVMQLVDTAYRQGLDLYEVVRASPEIQKYANQNDIITWMSPAEYFAGAAAAVDRVIAQF